MKHRNSHLLVGYWSGLRRGRSVPSQVDIDPRAIKRMLSYVFILEASDPLRPVYRLAGTSLCDRFGSELKGTNFLNHWEAPSHNVLRSLFKQSQVTRQPLCLSSIAATGGYGMVELETLLAPLAFETDAPTRFIGMVQMLGEGSHFGAKPIAFQRLIGSQLVREDEPLSADDPPQFPPETGPALRSHPKAPHLRLVVSREETATVHCDMDESMRRLIRALDIRHVSPVVRMS